MNATQPRIVEQPRSAPAPVRAFVSAPRPRPRPISRARSRRRISTRQYNTALNALWYGQENTMGDLFNDIMSTVVPGWDNRPDWMKKIRVKPDPAKLLSKAATVVPPSQVGNVVRYANQYGFDLWYKTPAGNMPVTPGMAEQIYGNYPAFARAQAALGQIPLWVWIGGGGLLLALLFARRR